MFSFAFPTLSLQNQCIMGIVDYIKKHPNATEADLAKAVQDHVAAFQAKVESM